MTALRNTLAIATILALAAAPMAAAKPQPASQAAAPVPTVTPEEQRALLNAEQSAAARAQLDQNTANQKAFDDATKARDAEIARVKAEYEAAVKKWEEDVAACKAGDAMRCAQAK
jgi:predicted methyltransferase